jgi:hypothetical protein
MHHNAFAAERFTDKTVQRQQQTCINFQILESKKLVASQQKELRNGLDRLLGPSIAPIDRTALSEAVRV